MARRPDEASGREETDNEPNAKNDGSQNDSSTNDGSKIDGATRRQRLTALLGQCTTARTEAESLGERLLTYLLAMAIEEARSAIDRSPLR